MLGTGKRVLKRTHSVPLGAPPRNRGHKQHTTACMPCSGPPAQGKKGQRRAPVKLTPEMRLKQKTGGRESQLEREERGVSRVYLRADKM